VSRDRGRGADLFSLDADAVVIPVNVVLNLNYTLGRAVAQRGGPALLERLQAVRRSLPGERMTLGTATTVDTRDLPHLPDRVIFVAWWNEDTPYDDQHLRKCYRSALRQALDHGVTSLVLPSLGGRGGVSPTRRARAICAVLKECGQLPRSAEHSVQHLLFADVAREPLAAIEDELNRRLYLP
jgi:O-acetyl-ADP-ribose deacetylase (regulator of RNase III)